MQDPCGPYMGMMGQNAMMNGAYNGAGMMNSNGMGAGGEVGAGAGVVAGLQPFDPSKMKQSRMGHYGYLEGRGRFRSLSLSPRKITLTSLFRTCWSAARSPSGRDATRVASSQPTAARFDLCADELPVSYETLDK